MTMTPVPNTSATDISTALMAARRAATPLSAYPGEVPATLEQAYAIQHRSMAMWQDDLVGFKVGGIGASFRNQYPSPWLAGPIFAHDLQYVEAGAAIDVPVYEGGFAAYEAEFVFKLKGLQTLNGPIATLAKAKEHISDIYIGAEIASSPMPMINALGPGSIISDFGNNGGMIIGPKVEVDDVDEIFERIIRLSIDGDADSTWTAIANSGDAGPLSALKFLLNHLQTTAASVELPDVVYLSSGAITGVHASQVGTSCHMDYADFGEFTLNMAPRAPMIHQA